MTFNKIVKDMKSVKNDRFLKKLFDHELQFFFLLSKKYKGSKCNVWQNIHYGMLFTFIRGDARRLHHMTDSIRQTRIPCKMTDQILLR